MAKSRKWDRHSILAEVHRRGENLTSLSVKNGLSNSSCRASMLICNPAADKVIAKFLNVSVHELWPDRYDENEQRIYPKRNRSKINESQETRGAA